MGSKRYLYWNDAVHGFTNYRFNINYCFSKTCFMVTNLDLRAIVQKHLYWPLIQVKNNSNLTFIIIKKWVVFPNLKLIINEGDYEYN